MSTQATPEDEPVIEVEEEAARAAFGSLDDEGKPYADPPPDEPTDVPAEMVKDNAGAPPAPLEEGGIE